MLKVKSVTDIVGLSRVAARGPSTTSDPTGALPSHYTDSPTNLNTRSVLDRPQSLSLQDFAKELNMPETELEQDLRSNGIAVYQTPQKRKYIRPQSVAKARDLVERGVISPAPAPAQPSITPGDDQPTLPFDQGATDEEGQRYFPGMAPERNLDEEMDVAPDLAEDAMSGGRTEPAMGTEDEVPEMPDNAPVTTPNAQPSLNQVVSPANRGPSSQNALSALQALMQVASNFAQIHNNQLDAYNPAIQHLHQMAQNLQQNPQQANQYNQYTQQIDTLRDQLQTAVSDAQQDTAVLRNLAQQIQQMAGNFGFQTTGQPSLSQAPNNQQGNTQAPMGQGFLGNPQQGTNPRYEGWFQHWNPFSAYNRGRRQRLDERQQAATPDYQQMGYNAYAKAGYPILTAAKSSARRILEG